MRCEECAKEIPNIGYDLKRPVLRNRDGVSSPLSSLVAIESVITSVGAGITFGLPITIPDNLLIGQLPGASIKAHICVRDVFIVRHANGTVTLVTGKVYYEDVWKRSHCVAAIDGLGATNNAHLLLIANSPITDAQPENLGRFFVNLNQFTLGTATNFSTNITANIDIQYEQ